MILMRMGQHDAQDLIGVFLDERRVGQDEFDARRRLVAKCNAQVHHNPFAIIGRPEAVEIEVHSDFVRPPEGQEHEFVVLGFRH